MRITDIEKSFIHFPTPQSGNSWRVNIQSILNSKNNTFYLLKECRSETINEKPYTSKRSAYEFLSIVESEKTACLMSYFNPSFVWLACGGSNGLNERKLRILQGRKVVLFPDHSKYEDWTEKANSLNKNLL